MGMGFQAESLGFQRNRSTTCKRIQQSRRIMIGRTQDLGFRRFQYFWIVGILPLYQLFQDAKQTLTLSILGFFSRKLFGMAGRVIHQTRPDDSACRCQRSPCPPKMQSRRMTMSYGLFTGRLCVDGFKRQSHFD